MGHQRPPTTVTPTFSSRHQHIQANIAGTLLQLNTACIDAHSRHSGIVRGLPFVARTALPTVRAERTTIYMNPKEKTRQQIDLTLGERDAMNLSASRGVAVREFKLRLGDRSGMSWGICSSVLESRRTTNR